jgi:hypothetical protein
MHYHLLPYIEQDNVHKNTARNSWRDTPNQGKSETVIKTYISPTDPTIDGDGRATDWGNRGQTSYSSNWHAFGGGWGEDWQIGGKARIPASYPDGTSNVIGFMERYAKCGPGTARDWDSRRYVSRIWAEDGEPVSNPVSTCYQITAWESPTFWIDLNPGVGCSRGFPDLNRPPANYPIDPATGISPYMTAIQITPTLQQCDPTRLQAMSAGGMLVVLMDGSVRSVSGNISTNTLARAITRNDGFVLGNDW